MRTRNYYFENEKDIIIMNVESWKLAEIDMTKKEVRFNIPWIPDHLQKEFNFADLSAFKCQLIMVIEKWFETKANLDNFHLKFV